MIESRLEAANLKYAEVLGQNKQLREQIDCLRRDRVVFEKVFAKLERDLGIKRQSIAKLVEEVGAVFDQRDLAIAKLRQLQQSDGFVAQDGVDSMYVEEIPADAP